MEARRSELLSAAKKEVAMLQEIWLIHPDAEMCEAFRRRFGDLPGVRVVPARFEHLEPHDCFVTAGNSYGLMTAGIDAAVVAFFGEDLMQRIQQRIMDEFLGEQPVGTAFIEATGHADRPFVAHAPTMRIPSSIRGTDKVYAATWAALTAIHLHNVTASRKIETAAFPAMGTGFGDVPFDETARQMATAYRHYREPPHRLDWDHVIERHKAIDYDGGKRVILTSRTRHKMNVRYELRVTRRGLFLDDHHRDCVVGRTNAAFAGTGARKPEHAGGAIATGRAATPNELCLLGRAVEQTRNTFVFTSTPSNTHTNPQSPDPSTCRATPPASAN